MRATACAVAALLLHWTGAPRLWPPGPVPPPAVAAQCAAKAQLDPVGVRRNGKSYECIPLDPNATVEACTELCCKDWSCAAFVFTPPTTLAPAWPGCTQHQACCSLLLGVPGPSGGAIPGERSAVMTPLPGPVPPFEPSTVFHSNVTFDNETFYRSEGDTWPTAWLADGSQLSACGDRVDPVVSPMSLFRVDGVPVPGSPTGGDSFTTTAMTGPLPVDPAVFCADVPVPAGGRPASVKPTTLLSVDGEVYWGIACMTYGDEPLFRRQHNYHAWIAKAANPEGDQWNFTATPTNFFTGKLAAPMFIQFGQDNALAPDDFIYAHFPFAADFGTSGRVESFWNNNDGLLLGRVPKGRVLDRRSWEFWAGKVDGGGDASESLWSVNETNAVSVMNFSLMLGMNQVNYHEASRRLLMANFGFIDLNGQPRPWHTHPDLDHHRTQLTIFEADQPWGPFRIFHRDDSWESPDGSGGGYCPIMPAKWLGNNTAWIVSCQCCSPVPGGPDSRAENHYNFTTQRIHFSYAAMAEPKVK